MSGWDHNADSDSRRAFAAHVNLLADRLGCVAVRIPEQTNRVTRFVDRATRRNLIVGVLARIDPSPWPRSQRWPFEPRFYSPNPDHSPSINCRTPRQETP